MPRTPTTRPERRYKDPYTKAVPLHINIDAPALGKAKRCLIKLNSVFNLSVDPAKGAILNGGTIRDLYLNLFHTQKISPRDFDIMLPAQEVFARNIDIRSLNDIRERLNSIEEITDIASISFEQRYRLWFLNTYFMILHFKYEGQAVDLKVSYTPSDLENAAVYGDAPLNSVAMDASGKIFAHPDFEKHAQEGLYSCRTLGSKAKRKAYRRYQRFIQKPGCETFNFECAKS